MQKLSSARQMSSGKDSKALISVVLQAELELVRRLGGAERTGDITFQNKINPADLALIHIPRVVRSVLAKLRWLRAACELAARDRGEEVAG